MKTQAKSQGTRHTQQEQADAWVNLLSLARAFKWLQVRKTLMLKPSYFGIWKRSLEDSDHRGQASCWPETHPDREAGPDLRRLFTFLMCRHIKLQIKLKIYYLTFSLLINKWVAVSSKIMTKTIWYHLYMESKIWHKWTHVQNRNRLTDTQNRLVVAKGERGWGRKGLEAWD